MDAIKYENLMEDKMKSFESRCKRCGECCGSRDGDPCENLVLESNGTYHCTAYIDRLGIQKTISGKTFNCVPIRTVMEKGALSLNCVYNSLTPE